MSTLNKAQEVHEIPNISTKPHSCIGSISKLADNSIPGLEGLTNSHWIEVLRSIP